MVFPLLLMRSVLGLPAAPVDENTQVPGPSAGWVVVMLEVLVKVYCALGVLLTCSKVAHSISGCACVAPTICIPTSSSWAFLVPFWTDWVLFGCGSRVV